jgi:iron complex transport system permease protein
VARSRKTHPSKMPRGGKFLIKHFVLSFFIFFSSSIFLAGKGLTDRAVTLSRVIRVSVLLGLVLFLVSLISMLVGPSHVGTASLLKVFFPGMFGGEIVIPDMEKTILFSIRLPRIIFAGLVGAALAAAGVVFQGLLRNPLADPYILGISGGSAVGAIIAIITGVSALPFGTPGLSFLGALLTIILVYGIARTNRELQSNTLLLAGVIVNAFFAAVIMFLVSVSSNTNLHSIMFWLMGDLSLVVGDDIPVIALFLVAGFVVIYVYARHLNLIVTGEETAMQLGVDVEKTKKVLFLVASLVTAAAVSVSGIIGFVGLIIPHIMRMLLGSDHRMLLPASLLFGASFLVVADTVARTIMAPAELPVGVITALCGAPYFIYLLRRRGV